MEKLTIQQIAPFYKTNLRFMNVEMKESCTLTGFDDDIIICLADDGHEIYRSDEYTLIPFMNHISCLTKTIQHGNESFVPIVELAKISYPSKNWYLKDGMATTGAFHNNEIFFFDGDDFICGDDFSPMHVYNQQKLWEKLAEWHINFVGIPEGLYIDKQTLK